jgi:molecular chaperone DnaK (HSP70)
LGGEDFDQRVMEYFIKLYKKKTGKDIRKDHRAVQKLRREVEKAKRALSVQHQVRVEVESLFDGEDFAETLTRAKFEELNMDLFRLVFFISYDNKQRIIDKYNNYCNLRRFFCSSDWLVFRFRDDC